MIKDKPNKLAIWFLVNIVERYLLNRFQKVSFHGDLKIDSKKSSLVIMNHFSFNDGFIMLRLSRLILKKSFKIMVIEAQLKAIKIIRYIGCFSINKKSKNMIESLNYASEILKNPNNILGIYPQGEVYSMHLNQIHFESGLAHILKKSKDTSFQIIFVVCLLDYLDSFKPHVRVYVKEYLGSHDLKTMEKTYNRFYKTCKIEQQQLHHPPASVIDQTK